MSLKLRADLDAGDLVYVNIPAGFTCSNSLDVTLAPLYANRFNCEVFSLACDGDFNRDSSTTSTELVLKVIWKRSGKFQSGNSLTIYVFGCTSPANPREALSDLRMQVRKGGNIYDEVCITLSIRY